MSYLMSAVLGFVQGVAEFLPISSSGHLTLLQHFFGMEEVDNLFNILLHFATLLAVCVYYFQDVAEMVVEFFRGIAALFSPLGMDREWARRLLTGALEMSSGVSSLTGGTLSGRLSMAAFMLGWAGLSVHCQVLAFLGDSGLSLRTYLAGKLLHGALSAAVVGGLVRLIPLPGTVSALLAGQTEAIAGLDFHRSLTLSAAAAWGTWLVFVALAVWAVKKNSGKCRRHGV